MPLDAQLDQISSDLRTILWAVAFVFGSSVVVCWALIKRWTTGRRMTALSEWTGEHGFAIRRAARVSVTPAIAAAKETLLPVISLTDATTRLIQLDTPGKSTENAIRWNVLSRSIEATWPPTALRPVNAERTFVDLFQLESFPVLGAGERFLVCGADKPAARILAKSSVRGLLPADVGLILHGNELLLDFTGRPFDEIEFGRMIAVVDQVAGKLPALSPSPPSGRGQG